MGSSSFTQNDYLQRVVLDFDSAYYYFNQCDKVRRDPVGSLDYNAYEMYRPNGMAAKAYKSRALLYAASPLNNKNGIADWQKQLQLHGMQYRQQNLMVSDSFH